MQYALIWDIHANLPALEAVLADIDQQGDADARKACLSASRVSGKVGSLR